MSGDATPLAPLRGIVEKFLTLSDTEVLAALLFMQGLTPLEVSKHLGATFAPGGEAERLAARLDDPQEMRRYVRALCEKFSPFADVLREILPDAGTAYIRLSTEYKKTSIAERVRHTNKERARHTTAEREKAQRERELTVKAGGGFFTKDGRTLSASARISASEAAAVFGLNSTRRLPIYANAGHIRRVYLDAACNLPGGFERATVEAYAAKRAAGTFYTADGCITGAERVSREEAAALIGCKPHTVTAIARRGEVRRTFLNPQMRLPCGFERASVEKYLQDHPKRIPAKRAKAVADFRIEILPPSPRAQRLHAARLVPDQTAESRTRPETTGDLPRHEAGRKKKPSVVFMLAEYNTHTNERSDMETTTTQPAEKTQSKSGKPPKLEVAKAYTVHEAGVIRAICVSEEDRAEIVAALEVYRRVKAAPGEIESALALFRTVKGIMETPQGAPAPEAVETVAAAAEAVET